MTDHQPVTHKRLERIIDQPLYDLPHAAVKLGNCSRSTLYRLIEQGKLVRVRLGGKALITGKSLAGYVEELLAPDATPDRQRHSQKRQDTAGDKTN